MLALLTKSRGLVDKATPAGYPATLVTSSQLYEKKPNGHPPSPSKAFASRKTTFEKRY
jgi:hypothetical protein